MSKYEPDSDDDSVVDEDDVFVSVPSKEAVLTVSAIPLPPSALQCVDVIDEDKLLVIAAQLSKKESEADKELEENKTIYENFTQPALKKTVEGLEKQIDKLKDQLGSTPSDELEDMLDALISEHKKSSCMLYFPNSVHRLAAGGVYCALDDFWLENVTGKFTLELLPAMGSEVGQLVFLLTGKDEAPGVSAIFHMSNFKLRGDSLLVPSLNYEDMDVEVVFTVTVVLSFNKASKKWDIEEDDFKVDVMTFEGPFGLTAGVISAVLGIVTPLLRRQVLRELPAELGKVIATLPCPLQVNGAFQVDGQPRWDEVIAPIISSESICRLLGQAPAVVLHLEAVQRSLRRADDKHISSLRDLISYQRKYQKTSCWTMLMELWQDAAVTYHASTCMFEPSDTADDPSQQAFSSCLSMEKTFLGATSASKFPVRIHIDIKMIEGQFGIKNALEQSNLFAKRMIAEMSKAHEKHGGQPLTPAEMQLLKNMKKMVLQNTDMFEFLLQRVDFMQGKSSVQVQSGPSAQLTGSFDQLSGQFPVALWTALPSDKIIGGNIIVPTLTKLETSAEGVLSFRFFQLGSVQMLEKCNLHKWFLDDLPDDEEALSVVELAELSIHRPLLSIIMDQPVVLPAGAALFTVQVGPQPRDWAPAGASMNPRGSKYLADITPLGDACPLLVQTSQQIKLLGKVPLVTTSVHLTKLMSFLNKHFEDLEVLLDVISLTSGAKRETCLQYINFAKIVLTILTKYVLKPGLTMDINMSTRVIANSQDIIVCLENRVPGVSAVELTAMIDIREIISDWSTLKSALFNAINHKSMIF